MSVQDKIKELEEEMFKTQKNKATEHHLGLLKAKLAKLRKDLNTSKKSGGQGGFEIKKTGDSTVVFIGLPSTGKSTLLNALTGSKSEAASYEFTTLTCIPGILKYDGAKIQLLDLPGIIEGASGGVGRGREILTVARNADLILLITDVYKPDRNILIKELTNIGIRIDQKEPDISIKRKERGGIEINKTVKLTKIDEKMMKNILGEYGVHNANLVIRTNVDVDQFIDVVVGNRKYIPSLTILNKVDLVTDEYYKQLTYTNFIPISAEKKENIEELKKEIYEKLDLIRVYTKPRREKADLGEPMMLKRNSTVRKFCEYLHKDLLEDFRYALVWGPSAKHPGQQVGLSHKLKDKDIVSIITKTGNI
ncbi:GTP-binding protein [Candidatus Micrarchaeota archaeon]|jgi:hypothetical protein|nr:GTP-binding protein [Candidatus Micrarchaeota archaeon]